MFAFVCQTIPEELHTNDYQYKTSVNLYSEKIKMDKNFFKVAGKPKMPANLPNGIAGRNFGQRLPPVKVTLNKMSRNGKDSNLKIKKLTKNMNFSLSFCSKKTPHSSKHAYGSAEQTFIPLVKRSRQPRKSYRLSNPKIWKKGQNLGQKSIFWSTKTQNFRKRQQEIVLISSIWGRMQNLRRIVGSVFEIVKNSAEIA